MKICRYLHGLSRHFLKYFGATVSIYLNLRKRFSVKFENCSNQPVGCYINASRVDILLTSKNQKRDELFARP
jgi:hypothetical protein